MTNETLQVIMRRRSTRAFSAEQLLNEQLQAILEAGCSAPYAQAGSRHVAVLQNAKTIEKLNEDAKRAARSGELDGLKKLGENEGFDSLYGAPTVVFISGKDGSAAPESDCAAAAQNMLIAAEALDIGACWIFFDLLVFHSSLSDEWKKALQIPADFTPYVSIALGHKAQGLRERTGNPKDVTYVR